VDLGLDFSVLVLATGAWPLQGSSFGFSIPTELQTCMAAFEQFYVCDYAGRKLTWLHHLAKGEIKTNYTVTNKAGYTLQASGYQVGILLQFNQSLNLSLKDLLAATQLDEKTLSGVIRTLLKTKILNSDPQIEDPEKTAIESSTVFTLNKQFKSPKGRMKVNINVPMKSEGGAEKNPSDETMASVMEERKLQMQAAIVRIMKARKTSKHSNLIAEVVEQLNSKFKPQVSQIKKCIDILIEKEYLERTKGEKDMYSYVA